MTTLKQLIDVLSVKTLSEDEFEGKNLYIPTNATYGGTFLSQSIIASALTTSLYRLPNSLHAYFLLPGNLSKNIVYNVVRLRDGAKFSNRRVDVFDSGKLIFYANVSFHETEESLVNFDRLDDVDINSPDNYLNLTEIFANLKHKNEWTNYFSHMPFEQKPTNPSLFIGTDKNPQKEVTWFRVWESDFTLYNKHKSELLNRALLTFLSDQFGFSSVMRRGKVSWLTKESSFTSLDHSIWFYENDIDLTSWHAVISDSNVGKQARGLGISYIVNDSFKIVACFAQEGLMRCFK